MRVEKFHDMIGQTMASVTVSKQRDVMTFTSTSGRTFTFQHDQDCCESVDIEDIAGDLFDLEGSPILVAEEVSNMDAPPCDAESYTWTFYKFATVKGAVTVRWLGTSNGYYGEGVSYYDSKLPCGCDTHKFGCLSRPYDPSE